MVEAHSGGPESQAAISEFTDGLLELATENSKDWWHAAFPVRPEHLDDMLSDLLSWEQAAVLLPNPGDALPGSQDRLFDPDLRAASIIADKQQFEDGSSSKTIELGLIVNSQMDQARLLIDIKTFMLHRTYFFLDQIMETGYEGHGYTSLKLSDTDLKFWLELFRKYLGNLAPQESMQRTLERTVFIDETETHFTYDPASHSYLSRDGRSPQEGIGEIRMERLPDEDEIS